jgi:DNA-binding beta-propeller fold protein YncE
MNESKMYVIDQAKSLITMSNDSKVPNVNSLPSTRSPFRGPSWRGTSAVIQQADDGSTFLITVSPNTHQVVRICECAGFSLVEVVAGATEPGWVDGDAKVARFRQPCGIAQDVFGNLWVADTHNHMIRKISPDLSVSTVAGSGTAAFADGVGRAAHFCEPHGIAIGTAGEIFVADTGNDCIRRICPATYCVTTMRSAQGPYFTFLRPKGLATFREQLVVADTGNNRVCVIANDRLRTLAGSGRLSYGDGGFYGEAMFCSPCSVTCDVDGNVLVCDERNVWRVSDGGWTPWRHGAYEQFSDEAALGVATLMCVWRFTAGLAELPRELLFRIIGYYVDNELADVYGLE